MSIRKGIVVDGNWAFIGAKSQVLGCADGDGEKNAKESHEHGARSGRILDEVTGRRKRTDGMFRGTVRVH
jgi:hypothetical protein